MSDAPKLTLRAKCRGTLLGVAIGDALGAPYEGSTPLDPRRLRELSSHPGPLRYTDDTHMTLGLAQSLVERKGFDGPHLAETFARNFESEPWRGYGAGPPRIFALIRQGVAWDRAASELFGGSGSYGNGAAMRVAPAALFAFPDLDHVERLARQTAVLTHTHELGIDGAVLQACAVAWLLGRNPADGLPGQQLLEELNRRAHTEVFREALDRVADLLATGAHERVVSELGHGIEAHRSVPTALYAFLRTPESFPDVVLGAISLGGDADTITAMAGALAGAYLGQGAIPAAWRDGVEGGDELRELADELFDLAGRPGTAPPQ